MLFASAHPDHFYESNQYLLKALIRERGNANVEADHVDILIISERVYAMLLLVFGWAEDVIFTEILSGDQRVV